MSDGLFNDIYRHANYKTREPREVVLTAALSYCLEMVPMFRTELLRTACSSAGVSMPRGPVPALVHLAHQRTYRRSDGTQDSSCGFDRPDVVVEYPNGSLVCAIECKLRAIITEQQAARYSMQLLASARSARRLLIGIASDTQARPNCVTDVGWASLSWTHVDDLARRVHDRLDGRTHGVSRYLLTEFRRLLTKEGLVFEGFGTDHLGEGAARALSAYQAWYELVRMARDQVFGLIVPRNGERQRLARNFNGVGFEAISTSWDRRKVRRTRMNIWLGVYAYEGDTYYPADWYPGVNLWFARHPLMAKNSQFEAITYRQKAS
ncbi:hypothetical protein [Sorangium sp. So ce1151]|uniref:hypothetical protein n=1 Tax=Sorangium sp. So ce1151 TaxID=3133332 RepID=UPI003F62E1EF